MVEKGIGNKTEKKSSGKCCCAIFTIVVIVAIGSVTFFNREWITEKLWGPGASEETFGGESSEYDFDESSDSSTRLPQESTMQPLNYDSGEAEISTAHFQNYDYDGGTVSSDGSIEEENRSPSIQESDSKESSEDENTTKRFEETTTPRKDETTIYEHSGSGLNSESDSEGFTKTKINKALETDDEDYQDLNFDLKDREESNYQEEYDY